MLKNIFWLPLIGLVMATGCEKDYQSPLIGKWQQYEMVDGVMTFDLSVTWTDDYSKFKEAIIFKADYTGEYELYIDGQYWPTTDFTYEIDAETITFIDSIDNGTDPPRDVEYSIDGDEMILGGDTFARR